MRKLTEDEIEARAKALAKHLDCDPEEITHDYDCTFSCGRQEYLVCTDSEADQRWEESIDSYIDDCLLADVPKGLAETLARYFDREAFHRDARFDGRGHSLSSYDGEEHESEGYYLFRLN